MHSSFSLEHLLSALKLSATFAFTVLCGNGSGRPASVGKVCKGFWLAVFVWFMLLYCLFLLLLLLPLLLLLLFFFLGFEMNVSIHFTLHCVPSGARHAKRTAGLGSQSHPRSGLRSHPDSDSETSPGVFGGEKCKRRRTRLATHCSASLQFVDLLR